MHRFPSREKLSLKSVFFFRKKKKESRTRASSRRSLFPSPNSALVFLYACWAQCSLFVLPTHTQHHDRALARGPPYHGGARRRNARRHRVDLCAGSTRCCAGPPPRHHDGRQGSVLFHVAFFLRSNSSGLLLIPALLCHRDRRANRVRSSRLNREQNRSTIFFSSSFFFADVSLFLSRPIKLKKKKYSSRRLHQARPPGRQGQPCPSCRPGARCQGRRNLDGDSAKKENVFSLENVDDRIPLWLQIDKTPSTFASRSRRRYSSLLPLAAVHCDFTWFSESPEPEKCMPQEGTGRGIATE